MTTNKEIGNRKVMTFIFQSRPSWLTCARNNEWAVPVGRAQVCITL